MAFRSPLCHALRASFIALMLLLCGALPADAGTSLLYWAQVPRDPDFYVDFDPEKEERPPRPMPDLSGRPTPRDSRTLFGAFAPDPQGTLRYYTVGGPRTSTCIGEPVSALCAIETMYAAWISQGPPPLKGRTVIYRVYDVKQIGPDDLKGPRPDDDSDPWYPRWFEPQRPWRLGDLQIQLLSMRCAKPGAANCDGVLVPVTYTVHQVAPGRWAIVSDYLPAY